MWWLPKRILLPPFEKVTSIGKEAPKWTDKTSVYYRLPEHYKQRYRETRNRQPALVHEKTPDKKYIVDHETGTREYIRGNPPIPVVYPAQSKLGLWAGEGLVPGYLRPHRSGAHKRDQYLTCKLWRPKILKLIFYSEILDKYYALTCTRRAVRLIEEAQSFDHYILKTHQVDLHSTIGMDLKREMLIRLAKKDTELYPNDKEKQNMIFNRYSKYMIPLEEAEWIGLSLWQALKKQLKSDEEARKAQIKPLKNLFADRLCQELDRLKIDGKKMPLVQEIESDEKKGFLGGFLKSK